MEFEFKITEIKSQTSIPAPVSPSQPSLNETYAESEYHALNHDEVNSAEIDTLQKTQIKLKTETLLLDNEEKRRNDKFKEIECVYTNSFNNFLMEKNRKKGGSSVIIVNNKDILQMDEGLMDEIELFRRYVVKMRMSDLFNVNSKPNVAFFRDFYNFFSNWEKHISDIIKMEIDNSQQIENAFESEYTFPAKVLSSLKLSANIELFCSEIFTRPLKEMISQSEELSLDFFHIYDPWLALINSEKGQLSTLAKFISKNDSSVQYMKKLKEEVSELMNTKLDESEKLIGEMSHFALSTYSLILDKDAITYLFSEIGCEEIDENTINIKLAVLVWKKILENRRKIESILIAFIDEILKNFNIIPREVKFIMREYYRLAKEKFGEVKDEDIKTFFNKVIYSQMLLPEFMRMLEEENGGVSSNVKNFNISIIALFSQKILYGQEFYDKQKYTYFNQLISHYTNPIQEFMRNFIDDIRVKPYMKREKIFYPILISLESIKYLYENMRGADFVPILSVIESKICMDKEFDFGSTRFKAKDVYLILISKKDFSYQQILKPKNKIKRIFIEFLTLIEQIPHSSTFEILLEQYKYASSEMENSSVEIHANYLSLVRGDYKILQLCSEINKDIEKIKEDFQKIKIDLEKEHSYAQNLEKVFMKKLKEKKKFNSMIEMKEFFRVLLEASAGFHYNIVENKVCEIEAEGPSKTLNKVLADIGEYYLKDMEGYDGLYHLLQEKVGEEVESQGIVNEDYLISMNELIGAKLYSIIKLDSQTTPKDLKIHLQMKKHKFVSLKLLELGQYEEEEELILEESLPILAKTKIPQSANELLKIFHETTMVFQNLILITGKASDITADVQIPMMILILIKSEITNLSSLIKFMEKFCSDDIHSSVLGQTLTLINSVAYLIEEMGAKQLNLKEDEYNKLCETELKRMQAESDGQFLIIDHESLSE